MSVREHCQCGVRQGRRSIDRRRYEGRQLVFSAIETLGKETRTSSKAHFLGTTRRTYDAHRGAIVQLLTAVPEQLDAVQLPPPLALS